jgi:hypothetical protein
MAYLNVLARRGQHPPRWFGAGFPGIRGARKAPWSSGANSDSKKSVVGSSFPTLDWGMAKFWAIGGLFLLLGCGPQGASDGAGGSTAPAGGTQAGGSGGLSVGGGASGGSSDSNGGSSDPIGGNSSGGTSNGTEDCPSMPAARLLPLVGPFQYGTDPGPCTQTNGTETLTYEYTDGVATRLLDNVGGEREVYGRDAMGRITAFTYDNGASSSTVTYFSDHLVDSNATSYAVTYRLSPTGYVMSAERDLDLDGTADGIWTYVYDDCHLVQRIAPEGEKDRVYSYDEAGRIVSLNDEGTVVTFDYSCW